jgi:hypothetical protein
MKREQISLGTKEQKRAFVLNQLLSRVVALVMPMTSSVTTLVVRCPALPSPEWRPDCRLGGGVTRRAAGR